MSAGRLLNLMLVLQHGGRLTARELAQRLEVSERTVLRDIAVLSGAGVPVYAIRGPGGGFEMLDTVELAVPAAPHGALETQGRVRRVRVRVAPAALRLALVSGTPGGWRPRPRAEPSSDRPDWVEGSFRFDSYDAAARALLALGPGVEVLLPVGLREAMAAMGREITRLHQETTAEAEPTDTGSRGVR